MFYWLSKEVIKQNREGECIFMYIIDKLFKYKIVGGGGGGINNAKGIKRIFLHLIIIQNIHIKLDLNFISYF